MWLGKMRRQCLAEIAGVERAIEDMRSELGKAIEWMKASEGDIVED